jgi:hypothetical protein
MNHLLCMGFSFNFIMGLGFDLKKGWEMGFREHSGWENGIKYKSIHSSLHNGDNIFSKLTFIKLTKKSRKRGNGTENCKRSYFIVF